MKLRNIFLGIAISTIALIVACDKITNPIFPKQTNGTLPNTPPAFIDSSVSTGLASYTQKKMLLEVCGGQQCTNCPTGEQDAEKVLNSPIGGQVVFMDDMMGPDAATGRPSKSAPPNSFNIDYQCEADSNWFYYINPNEFPWGMVNREGAPNNTSVIYFEYQDSCNKILNRIPTSPAVTIDIHDSCWINPRIIGVEIQLNFKRSLSASSIYLLETAIVEDNVVGWQVNNGVIDSNYVHRNVLRGSFDGQGVGVPIPVTTAGSTWTSYQTYNFTTGENGKAAGWNMANCYIVAFVYGGTGNTANPWEVVQAEMIKVE